jgi:hypothetical protein
MKRDVTKHIEEGRKIVAGTKKDLALSEFYELCGRDKADADAVIDAFYMGVAVGARKAAAR